MRNAMSRGNGSFARRALAPAVGVLSALALVLGTAPWAAAGVGTVATGGHLRAQADGPANCNCSGSEAELSVCHVSRIDVRVGTAELNVQTGQSESTCGSKTVPDGTCIYYRYNFDCERGWFRWHCVFIGTGLKERPATDDDC
jgi:hypothetical protein